MISIETTKQDFKDNYKLLIGAIVPRPIAVVSTRNEDGSNNIAPFSFFNGVCSKPMIISFCPVLRTATGEKKDTLVNIERTKEFVVNFVTESTMEAINKTSTELPYGEDEFEYAGLTPMDSSIVGAKRLKESPIHFECRLRDILQYGDGGPGTGFLVTGEVLMAHVEDKVYDRGRVLTDEFRPVGRGAGNDWVLTKERAQLDRLMKAQIQK
ncbi:MAG: flavin reductase family protein [Bacteriovoracales bacterium]|nr:flavin reductase family protein [Bacteriovoracales bacterium]